MTMHPDLQKPELFVKLMQMTQSENDNIALMSIRKANSILAASGLNWEQFIAAHFTIIPDPFASIPEPARPASNGHRPAAPTPPRAPAPPPPPTPPKPKPAPMTAAQRHAANQKYQRKKTTYRGPIDLNDL